MGETWRSAWDCYHRVTHRNNLLYSESPFSYRSTTARTSQYCSCHNFGYSIVPVRTAHIFLSFDSQFFITSKRLFHSCNCSFQPVIGLSRWPPSRWGSQLFVPCHIASQINKTFGFCEFPFLHLFSPPNLPVFFLVFPNLFSTLPTPSYLSTAAMHSFPSQHNINYNKFWNWSPPPDTYGSNGGKLIPFLSFYPL